VQYPLPVLQYPLPVGGDIKVYCNHTLYTVHYTHTLYAILIHYSLLSTLYSLSRSTEGHCRRRERGM
jgi:hypothetical protein